MRTPHPREPRAYVQRIRVLARAHCHLTRHGRAVLAVPCAVPLHCQAMQRDAPLKHRHLTPQLRVGLHALGCSAGMCRGSWVVSNALRSHCPQCHVVPHKRPRTFDICASASSFSCTRSCACNTSTQPIVRDLTSVKLVCTPELRSPRAQHVHSTCADHHAREARDRVVGALACRRRVAGQSQGQRCALAAERTLSSWARALAADLSLSCSTPQNACAASRCALRRSWRTRTATCVAHEKRRPRTGRAPLP